MSLFSCLLFRFHTLVKSHSMYFPVRLISLGIMLSRSVHVANGKFPSFLWLSGVIPFYGRAIHHLYPLFY